MSVNLFQNKRIVLGVTGSIACYKSIELASKLAQAGLSFDTVLSGAALQFVTPLTFQSVTGQSVYTDDDLWGSQAHVLHVGLAHQAHLLVLAPATANTLAKLAHGVADSLLTITALAATCPLLVVPAMDGGMFDHPATQENLQTLVQRGATVIGPESGHLASGLIGKGRMSEPATIYNKIRYLLSRGGPLAGRKVVVTAGGTRESVDPIRFLTNHSSGKQGFAIAQSALDAGADVVLITTQEASFLPQDIQQIPVSSANQMLEAVLAESQDVHVLVMAAAVADFRPAQIATQKIKKQSGMQAIPLAANPDILVQVAQQRQSTGWPRVVIGFAAETQNLLENAAAKLERKFLDLIVANDVSAQDAGFAVNTNRVTLLGKDDFVETLPLLTKTDVAEQIIQYAIDNLSKNNQKL